MGKKTRRANVRTERQRAGRTIEDHWSEVSAVLVGTVGCVVEGAFVVLVVEVLCCRGRQSWILGGWAEARSHCEVPSFRDRVFPHAGTRRPLVGRGWCGAGVRRSPGAAECPVFSYLRTEPCFLGSFEKDVSERVASAVPVSCASSQKRARTSRFDRTGSIVYLVRETGCEGGRCQLKMAEGVSLSARPWRLGPGEVRGGSDLPVGLGHQGIKSEGVTQAGRGLVRLDARLRRGEWWLAAACGEPPGSGLVWRCADPRGCCRGASALLLLDGKKAAGEWCP